MEIQSGRKWRRWRFWGLTGALLLRVAGRVVAVGVQGLRPLLAGRVAGLVGVPRLLAVVAELCAAAFSATNQPGTAGTARGDDGKPERKRRKKKHTEEAQMKNISQVMC